MTKTIEFTQDPPTMDPDKPVQCLWFVMFRQLGWSGEMDDVANSQGPFEDRSGAEHAASMQHKYGNHVVAIVPVIFQEGDYIADYKPYAKPKPEPRTRADDFVIDLNHIVQAGQAHRMYPLPEGMRQGVQVERAWIVDDVHMPFWRQPEPEPIPVVQPGDGIAAALAAKTAKIKQKRPAHLDLPGQGKQGVRDLKRDRGITVSSQRWTGRGKR